MALLGSSGSSFPMGGDYDTYECMWRPRWDVNDMDGGTRRETDEEYARRIEEEDREYEERYAQQKAEEEARQKAFQKKIRGFRNRFKKRKDTPALHKAIRKNDIAAITRALKSLKQKEKVNEAGESGLCPLNLAVWAESPTAIMLLLDNNANLFMDDEDGNTPIHTAVIAENAAMLAILLTAAENQFGWDIYPDLLQEKNKDGYTPLELAKALGDTKTEELLKRYMPWWRRIFS